MTAPQAEQAERDLAGAAVASIFGAGLVADLVPLDAIYDLRLRRITEAAVALPADPDVDLSEADDGVVIGKHLMVWGMAMTGAVLARIMGVANITSESPQMVAEMVAALPCEPCPAYIKHMAQEVEEAAQRRVALLALREAQLALIEGTTSVANAIEPVRRLAS